MRLILYIFAAVTLIGIAGVVTHMVNPDNYAVEVMGFHLNFPVAVWVAIPAVVLLLFTVVHMAYHGTRAYMRKQKWQRDVASLEDALYWALLNEPKEQKYLIDEIKRSATVLNKANLTLIDGVEGISDRLAKIINILNKIKNGEYVDLKENKLHKALKEGNPYLIQNRLNRLESDPQFVEEVMRSSVKYSDMVRKQALAIYARTATFEQARKYAKQFDIENFFTMLERLDKEEELEITPDILNEFVHSLKLKCSDFVRMARIVKRHLRPEENLSFFRKLQKENPKAQNAYLYLLFEYELLDEVERYLEEQDENDFIKFRALLELKKQNQRFKLEDLIDAESICRNV
jgi:hypothetical protein